MHFTILLTHYLIPFSVDNENVVNNIPKIVRMRLRRLCLDRVEGVSFLQMPQMNIEPKWKREDMIQ